jgi:ABC-type polysaccharide/polyol phosphate export permease
VNAVQIGVPVSGAMPPPAPPAPTAQRSLQLILFEIRTSSAGSVLGMAWAVVQPLLLLAAYWFLLTVLGAKQLGPGGTSAQVLLLLSGLVPWLFIARSISRALTSLTQHGALVRQTNFPLGILPFVSVGVQGVDFLVGLVVILVLAAAGGFLSWPALLVVPVALLLAIFLVALSVLLGPLAVMLRDLRRLLQVTLRAGMFLTPVLYLPDALPDGASVLAYANPAAYFIGLLRYAVSGTEDALLIDLPADLAIVTGLTLALAAAAYALRGSAWRMAVDHI